MEQKEAIKSNALSEKCFIRPGQKLAILIVGSVLLSLTFVCISMWLYSATGVEQVDLSRPGFKDVRGQSFQRNEDEDSLEYSNTGPINKESLDEFEKKFDKAAKDATSVESFASDVLSDKALGIDKKDSSEDVK